MVQKQQIERFVRLLKRHECGDDVSNFYAKRLSCRQNLRRYLQQMAELSPKTLLVGEAPGYNGCARTGIPFSSERLVREGVCEGVLFGAHNGYVVSDKNVAHERTAATLWSYRFTCKELPLLWNAYAFHPHRPGNRDSNRKPRVREIDESTIYLRMLIEMFDIQKVIAVGNSAASALTRADILHVKVRHPSYGGTSEFLEGMQKHLG